MPMDAKVYALLSEALKDKKIASSDGKELPLLDVIVGWNETVEASEKIRKANDDISAERETLKADLKTLKKTIDDSKAELERYRKNSLTDADKASFEEWKKKGMTSDVEARINALQAKLDESITKQSEMSKSLEEKEALTQKAQRDKLDADLRSELQAKLADKKISGKNAKLAIAAILSDGLAKLNEKGERVFTVIKDGKNLAASIDELVSDFATQNENLIDASGNRGTGAETGQSTNRSGGAGLPADATLDQVRQHGQSMLSMPLAK